MILSAKYNITRQIIRVVAIALVGLSVSACGSSSTSPNNGGNGNGGNGMDQDPTFTNVQTIFNNSCSGSGCHINERTNGVRLDSYDNAINSVGTQYGTEVIVPGEPGNSPLIDKISNDDPEFGDRMPEGRAALSDDKIALIREWIDQGAQNN
jgi:hypothetical protein